MRVVCATFFMLFGTAKGVPAHQLWLRRMRDSDLGLAALGGCSHMIDFLPFVFFT